MVNITKDDFNKDLDSYLSRRRSDDSFVDGTRTRFKDMIRSKRKPGRDALSSILNPKKKAPEINREEVEMTITEVEYEDDVEEYSEPRRPGFFKRLFSGFGRSRIPEEVEEFDDEDEYDEASDEEDLKEVIRILHTWLEQLPPEKISQFKRSPDFERYKSALRRLGMIKED